MGNIYSIGTQEAVGENQAPNLGQEWCFFGPGYGGRPALSFLLTAV